MDRELFDKANTALEENIIELVRAFAHSTLEERKRTIEMALSAGVASVQDSKVADRKLKDMVSMEKFDAEKLREVIKVIRVHSQEEIEIVWNFDNTFLEQR